VVGNVIDFHGDDGSFRSVADITSPETLLKVRDFKKHRTTLPRPTLPDVAEATVSP